MPKQKIGENYDLSIADLFSGALFIFIILLVYFIIQFNEKKNDLTKPLTARTKLLENIKKEILQKGIKVTIDKENGVLRIPVSKECSYFKSGEYRLNDCGRKNFKKIRNVFTRIIPCYVSKRFQKNCAIKEIKGKKYFDFIDTVLIEGHTDYEPIGDLFRNYCTEKGRRKQRNICNKCNRRCLKKHSRNKRKRRCKAICEKKCHNKDSKICLESNFHLSSMRSRKIYSYLLGYEEPKRKSPKGNILFNIESGNKKIFGVTGFGSSRPVEIKKKKYLKTREFKKYNRRIDFRFIMATPEEIKEEIKKGLKKNDE